MQLLLRIALTGSDSVITGVNFGVCYNIEFAEDNRYGKAGARARSPRSGHEGHDEPRDLLPHTFAYYV